MIERLRFSFPEEGTQAEAQLLWPEAPEICRKIVELTPLTGTSHHAIYSGSECVLLLPTVLRLPLENATSDVAKGDIAFAWMAAGTSYGVTEDFAEICWFYDLDAQPRMWEGPVEVGVFARFIEPAQGFYAVCRRMRREGIKPLVVEAVAS